MIGSRKKGSADPFPSIERSMLMEQMLEIGSPLEKEERLGSRLIRLLAEQLGPSSFGKTHCRAAVRVSNFSAKDVATRD